MNDPFLSGARALRDARNKGMINEEQYRTMYTALAQAAEQDAQACEVPTCERPAYIGKRCAHHTDIEQVREMARRARYG